ncbi:MAG: ribosomal RNA small subunit methyltransferase A [Candidatus Abawacabacteria bacterium]|nr:ribosomal RNA small subunit methyltransferase A [Candidatus Abawacabacteria bacterium]
MSVIAKKYLGQHFLHDRKVLTDIVKAGQIEPEDIVLEIGAGQGILTEELVKLAKQVIAYEIDNECFPILDQLAKIHANLTIEKQSVLDAKPPLGPYKVIANIPYYLTGTILRLFLHIFNHQPKLLVLLIQKEVAAKIISSESSLLSLAVQVFGKATIVRQVGKGAFTPPPQVESAVIRIVQHMSPVLTVDTDSFFRFLRPCFQGSRKQVQATIRQQVGLSREQVIDMLQGLNIDPRIRPSKLNLATWEKIVQTFLPYTNWQITTSPSPKS